MTTEAGSTGVTRRQALVGASLGAATLATFGRAAAVGAQSATPGAAGDTTTTRPALTTAGVQAILEAALAKATELQVPSVITIIDASGAQLAFFHMTGAPMISHELSPIKASSALAFGAPTSEVAKNLAAANDPTLIPSILSVPGITLVGGGFPIMVDDALVGAIGASGGTVEQDEQVAQAGLAAVTR